jgi:hypothetical protein
MKNYLFLSFIAISLLSVTSVTAQDCKVLMPDIDKEYQGECKKGLAHGDGIAKGVNTYEGEFKNGLPNGTGTLTYATGEIYEGSWKNGLKNGTGSLTQIINGKDSIINGIWDNDKYIGEKKLKEYQVIKKLNVQRYSIRKNSDAFNQVTIRIKSGSLYIAPPQNTHGSSGSLVIHHEKAIFENISYPFTCTMTYEFPSTTGAQQSTAEFSFKLLTPGDWQVEINH